MKIATFNINNVNKRLANLLAWLDQAKPDVVCLQELKAADEAFPVAAIEKAGYGAVWRGQKAWNGVAILAHDTQPILTHDALPGDPKDAQSRYIEAAVHGILVGNLYAPNGNPQPGPKFKYKLAWNERFIAHAAELYVLKAPVVLAGDYNIVPTPFDIYPTKSYDDNALVQPEPRAQFARLLAQGWVDAIRALHPKEPMYSFWHYMRNRWPRDAGLRLDHLLLNHEAGKRLMKSGVDREVRGADNASDHAPAWIILRDKAAGKTAPARFVPEKAKPLRASAKASTPKTPSRTAKAKPKPKPTSKERRPLLVIDGDSFAHRSYHALPKNILRAGGKSAGAILGFANMLLRLYREERPRAVLVCWDTLDEPTYRHEAYEAYQGGREFDDAIVDQLEVIPEFVAACGFQNAREAGYEADDLLASAAAKEEKRGGTVLVASGDRDSFQLASVATTILYPVRAGEMARIGPKQVHERYGVEPRQVPDFIAIRGDPSDKLPGVPGVGAAGAARIIERYGSLDAALKAGRFAESAERLRLFRDIATMDRKAKLPPLRNQTPTWDKAAELARDWELKQLAARLAALADDRSAR